MVLLAEGFPKSRIARSLPSRIEVLGYDLCQDLIGRINLGDMLFLEIRHRLPDSKESRLFNALLVALAEHGITPSTLAARFTYLGSPEALQAAVAAGILGAGSVFLGSMEGAANMLTEALTPLPEPFVPEQIAKDVVNRFRTQGQYIPGIGHNIHRDGDPRAARLFALAKELGYYGRFCELMEAIARAASDQAGRMLPVNATGAIGAILCEMGIDARLARGIGVAARAVGLVGHLQEELERPLARPLWEFVLERAEGSGDG